MDVAVPRAGERPNATTARHSGRTFDRIGLIRKAVGDNGKSFRRKGRSDDRGAKRHNAAGEVVISCGAGLS